MFGFFESIDDSAVAAALFDQAKAWFATKDITQLRGPANPSQNHTWGLLVDGFDSKPKFMMTYNKPYYEKLILESGFEKSQDMYAFTGHVSMLESLDPKLQFVVDEAKRRFKVTTRPIDKKNFTADVESFLRIYNSALPGQWGFTPMTEAEMKETAKGLKMLLAPELTTMAEIDGVSFWLFKTAIWEKQDSQRSHRQYQRGAAVSALGVGFGAVRATCARR